MPEMKTGQNLCQKEKAGLRCVVSGVRQMLCVELEGVVAYIPCQIASITMHCGDRNPVFIATCSRQGVTEFRWSVVRHPFSAIIDPQEKGVASLRVRGRQSRKMAFEVPHGATLLVIANNGDITEII